jgi:hypothetical protein
MVFVGFTACKFVYMNTKIQKETIKLDLRKLNGKDREKL